MFNVKPPAIRLAVNINDVIITPGAKGAVRVKNIKGDDIITIGSDKTISILGETFSLELIKEWLSNFKSDSCRCTVIQLMNRGCTCGGS